MLSEEDWAAMSTMVFSPSPITTTSRACEPFKVSKGRKVVCGPPITVKELGRIFLTISKYLSALIIVDVVAVTATIFGLSFPAISDTCL
ncbi:hypothetical protein DSECCO2_439680 [anaerobic digester metagenome]